MSGAGDAGVAAAAAAVVQISCDSHDIQTHHQTVWFGFSLQVTDGISGAELASKPISDPLY